MQIKNEKRFFGGLNTDSDPSELPDGDYVDGKNIRTLSSASQHGAGPAETLQGEISLLIAPDSSLLYYGGEIGGSFVYPGYSEVSIGDQVWMKKNWDAEYPGSKVYDNNEDNAAIYGRLYTHGMVMSTGFVPDGWRVPTEADWDILLTHLGGELIAGGKMKEVGASHWTDPNTGADDSSGFRAVPGGKFDVLFDLLGDNCLLWLQDEGEPTAPVAINGSEITAVTFIANWLALAGVDGYYLDVSLSSVFASFVAGYEDLDVGNVLLKEVTGLTAETEYFYRVRAYNEVGASENSNTQSIETLFATVIIGTQEWMVENLKTTVYNDGTPISNIINDATWVAATAGAYCWYDNDAVTYADYGCLYNWYAVETGKLAPAGWRVPSDSDIQTLIDFCGGNDIANEALREIGSDHWDAGAPWYPGTDLYGFKGLGSGIRAGDTGLFHYIKVDLQLWTSTTAPGTGNFAWCRVITGDYAELFRYDAFKPEGMAVRCMRDI